MGLNDENHHGNISLTRLVWNTGNLAGKINLVYKFLDGIDFFPVRSVPHVLRQASQPALFLIGESR